MTKSELIDRLAERMPGCSRNDLELVVRTVFEAITKTLEKGGRVELRGFGSFFIKHREPRLGCDPRTGKSIRVDNRYIPFFRAGKLLLDTVNT